MTESKWIRLSDNAAMQQVDGETVVLCVDRGLYYKLDAVATHMLNAALSSTSFETACTGLLEVYEAPEETLRSDLRRFLDQMSECGVIELMPHSTPHSNLDQ